MVVAGGNGTLSSERCSLDEEKFVCNEMTPSLTDHEFGVSFLVPSDYCVTFSMPLFFVFLNHPK